MVAATPPLIPETAPFTPEQRAWLNGFIAGILARSAGPASAPSPAPAALKPLTILFGSQTGTAEKLAKRTAKAAGQRGFAPTIVDMAQRGADSLAQERNLLVIVSTYGDGEPPDNAKALHVALRAPGAPRLSGVRFGVCGLGDTNYTRFCQAAKDFDRELERLGGERIVARVDCDVDYESGFASWLDLALSSLGASEAALAAPASTDPEAAAPGFNRKNPYEAQLVASRVLNGEGSAKQVRHVEFLVEGSGLAYEAGDALGVWAQNCPELVTEILGRLGCDGEEAVSLADGSTASFRRALTTHCDLGRPTPDLAARYAAPLALAGDKQAPLHILDLIAARPETRLAPNELVRLLRPLSPRLYSISSSPRAHAGSIHLTVARVQYEAHGRFRKGVCSTFLGDRVVPGESRIGIFVHSNASFRLPQDSGRPIIMVGPGTGVAPFRGFLHERRASGSRGGNWLFFGDQRASSDFLYGDELAVLQKEGVLTRLDTAFSRDQEKKIYVQHRMLGQSKELFQWLEEGAHLYVCGDASRMAKDVDAALLAIVAKEGGKSPEQAGEYLNALRAQKRYCRDVY